MRSGTVRDPGLWDRLVNERWDGQEPVLSPDDSIKAAKRIFRQAMGRAWVGPVRLTSGNRYTWVRRGTLIVNPDMPQRECRGLRAMIHDLSHYAHSRLNPSEAPHSRKQAQLEGRLVTYALKSGFAEGRVRALGPAPQPKPEPVAKPAVDKVAVKHARMAKRRDSYRAQVERFSRLLAKAEREVRDYERRHRGRVG
ncbi:MAG: hypothetical protein WKF79_00225 [Nocardioides sp.]